MEKDEIPYILPTGRDQKQICAPVQRNKGIDSKQNYTFHMTALDVFALSKQIQLAFCKL